MSEQEKPEKISGFWKKIGGYISNNVMGNIKRISATFASMLTTLFGLILYGIKADLDIGTILITLVFALQPFINIWVNIIFRGEAEILEREVLFLNKELEFQRDLSEYQLKVVALKANSDWQKANTILESLDENNTT